MELQESQEMSLRTHMAKLIKLTKNLPKLLEKLLEYDLLNLEEVDGIKLCSDDETSFNFLYENIITKLPSPSCFDLLLFSLRDTDNEKLAELLEASSKFGDENKRRLRRQSSSERYTKAETRSVSLGAEMGIAEILEDYPEFLNSLENLTDVLKLKDYKRKWSGLSENFVAQATLIIREWVEIMKGKANVVMFCRLLEDNQDSSYCSCADRLRRMFDNYVDSGFAFDFPGHFTIAGKETKIAQVLDDNPSFCLYPERLYLMLALPIEKLSNFTNENTFIKNASKMLIEWTFYYPDRSSIDHLAALLALNGHFFTAEKVSNL